MGKRGGRHRRGSQSVRGLTSNAGAGWIHRPHGAPRLDRNRR
jgi:hypothetical protein